MALKYSAKQRKLYLNMTDAIGARWIDVFQGDTDFYSAAYWDLLTNIWRQDAPVRKTDALRFMTGIKSAHTAGKYIDIALKKGFLEEMENPKDARSKLVSLSSAMRRELDEFFDNAVEEVREMSVKLPKRK
ncbi:MAG: MarR family transcriptional regulator [Alphaproteobacteria bacterium]|nr:MarR family transcriptional regulator [Alphaproteobacteria bacterium]